MVLKHQLMVLTLDTHLMADPLGQPLFKQQHLPLATGESEEGSVDYDSEDSIRVISIQLGYPAGQQEQQGRKGKNATQSSVAVKGQSNVGQIQ